MKNQKSSQISIFNGKKIRKTLHQNEWRFSIIDVIETLTESANPRDYWFKMKIRIDDEEKIQLSTICRQLKLESIEKNKWERYEASN